MSPSNTTRGHLEQRETETVYRGDNRRNGNPGRRDEDRSKMVRDDLWELVSELTGLDTSTHTGREECREVFRDLVALNKMRSKGAAAAIRWLIVWTGTAVAGLIVYAIDQHAPSIGALLRKIGLHP